MALSALSDPDFQWDVRANWTQVYQEIEKRALARACAGCAPPSGAAIGFDPAVDLRTKAEGYNLQLWATTGWAGPGTINHWFHDLQNAAASVGAAQTGGAPSWPSAQPLGGAYGAWVDDASPIAGAGGFNYLNVTAKCGFHGEWRRKRPREISSTTATADWWGNAAVPGQRAYLQTGSPSGNYAGDSPIYRCVASGNWVLDTDRPHGPPDELDSDNAPATNNNVPYGMFQPGDYFGTHLFDELGRRLLALKACTSTIQDPHVTAGQGSSDRQVPVPPGDDPTATATQFAPDEGSAVGRMNSDWHAFTRDPNPVGGATNWSFVWNAQMGASTGYDDFGDPGYSVSGIKNFIDGGRIFSTLAGTMFMVWHDVTAATEPWDFDGQGTGLTPGGYVAVGSGGFGAGADATTPVMVSIAGVPTPATPTTAYNSPPAPPPGGPGGNSVVKGCQFTVHLYTVWSF